MAFMRTSLIAASAAVLTIVAASSAASLDPAARTLAAARHAQGTVPWNRLGLVIETGTEKAAGLTGRFRLAQDIRTGRMHLASDLQVLKSAEVWDGRTHWRQDHSGGVHALNSPFAQQNATTGMWLARRGYLRPDAEGARVEFLGVERTQGDTFDKLRTTPRDGQPVELWFDRKTGLLCRSVWQMPISTKTIRYENYHRAAGLLLPFKVTEDQNSENPDITLVERVEVRKERAPDEFAPLQTPEDFTVAGGVATVPVVFDHDVIVEAKINGQGPFGFILDTGGHNILTPAAAKALGLRLHGGSQSGGAGEGTLTEQYTNVDRVEIGGVSLRDQAVFVIPMQYDAMERGPKPILAGILGVELFERFAMELNYRAQTLTFRPLAGAPEGHGAGVPIVFTDDSPLFPAKIDGIVGDVSLDTGNSGTLVVQGLWADAQGLTPRLEREGIQSVGFGAGGMSKNLSTYADFEVAGARFMHMPATYQKDAKGAFSSRAEAGNAGNDVYANFTLSFDYRRNTVWFDPVPAHQIPSRGRAGFASYKETADAFIVAVVAPGGPAAEAGLAVKDKITAVDGIPANQLSGWDLWRLVRAAPGTKLKLDYLRSDEKRSATIVLRDL